MKGFIGIFFATVLVAGTASAAVFGPPEPLADPGRSRLTRVTHSTGRGCRRTGNDWDPIEPVLPPGQLHVHQGLGGIRQTRRLGHGHP